MFLGQMFYYYNNNDNDNDNNNSNNINNNDNNKYFIDYNTKIRSDYSYSSVVKKILNLL